MNLTAKELSGMHIGKQIELGDSYATITKIESDSRTVNINATSGTKLGAERYFLSIPATASITIQDEQ